METKKRCSLCKNTKPLNKFHRDKGKKDGHGSRCKVCNSKRAREWRLKNKERYRSYMRKYYINNKDKRKDILAKHRRKIKSEVINYYGGVCQCCLEENIEFLVIDHIYGGGSIHRRKIKKYGSSFYRWLIANNMPDGYRVLCANCNTSYGLFGYCPHKKED